MDPQETRLAGLGRSSMIPTCAGRSAAPALGGTAPSMPRLRSHNVTAAQWSANGGAIGAPDLTVAANQIFDGRYYRLGLEDRALGLEDWLSVLEGWCERYPIVSLEDVLAEDDWAGWRRASHLIGDGCQLVGDDLFASQFERFQRGAADNVANSVLVKPNQAGTISRA